MPTNASEHALLTPPPLLSVTPLLSPAPDTHVSVLNPHDTPHLADVVVHPHIDMKQDSQSLGETHNLVTLQKNSQDNTEETPPPHTAPDLDGDMLMPEENTHPPHACVVNPPTQPAQLAVVARKQDEPQVIQGPADAHLKTEGTHHKVEVINALDGNLQKLDSRSDVTVDNPPHVEVDNAADVTVDKLARAGSDGKLGNLVESDEGVVEEPPVLDSTEKNRHIQSDDAQSTQVEQNHPEVKGGEQLRDDCPDAEKSDAKQNDDERSDITQKKAAQKNVLQNVAAQSDATQSDVMQIDLKQRDDVQSDVVQSDIKQGSIEQSDVEQSDTIQSDVSLDVGNYGEIEKADSTNQDGVERNECKMDVVEKDDVERSDGEKIEIGGQISMSDSIAIDATRGEKRPSPCDTSDVEAKSQKSDSKADGPSYKRQKPSPGIALSDASTDDVKSKKPNCESTEPSAKSQKAEVDPEPQPMVTDSITVAETAPKSAPIPSSKPVVPRAEPTKPEDTTPSSKTVPPVASSGGIQVMLRSSPVLDRGDVALRESIPRRPIGQTGISDAAGNLVEGNTGGVGGGRALESGSATVAETQSSVEVEPRKAKSVRWAPEEKLVDVKYIDTRVELLRSWDPESDITLPFAPMTLQTLRGMAEEQSRAGSQVDNRAAQGGGGDHHPEPRISTFEVARKKEHDRELESAKQAREELQKRLDDMQPTRPWVRPSEIVLPAECRIDPETIEIFTVIEDGMKSLMRKRDPNTKWPCSPLPEFRPSQDMGYRSDAEVPFFPLRDGAGPEAGEVHDSSRAINDYSQNSSAREGGMHHGYNDSGVNRGMSGGRNGDSSMHRRVNGHDLYGMHPQGMTSGPDNIPDMMFNGLQDAIGDKNGQQIPQNTVQHLLSALQSSGLLDQSDGAQNNGNGEEYGSNNRSREMRGAGGVYDDQHGMAARNGDINDGSFHGNGGGYMDDERRRGQGLDDGMVPRNGMSMPNGMGPPLPPFGHPGQLPPGFPQGVQQGGMMDGFGFPMPPMPPPPMGLPPPPNMLPMGMPMGLPPMGLPIPFGMPPGPMQMNNSNKGSSNSKNGKSGGNRVETISRPKSKGSKQRKRCKYFGTKQGCRDGSSCVFGHN